MCLSSQFSNAQTNTFPTSGDVGIGTTSPDGTDKTASLSIKKHEYGHYLVSMSQGPLYVPLNIGTFFTAGTSFHKKMPWERWADKASHKYFNAKKANAKPYGYGIYKINGYSH